MGFIFHCNLFVDEMEMGGMNQIKTQRTKNKKKKQI